MRNPLRTLAGWVRPPDDDELSGATLRDSTALDAVEEKPMGETDDTDDTDDTVAGSVESDILDLVRDQFAFFTRRLENESRRGQKGFTHELGALAASLQKVREDVDERLRELEDSQGAIANLVEAQLQSTERSLVSLSETSERKLRVLEESRGRLTREIEDVAAFLEDGYGDELDRNDESADEDGLDTTDDERPSWLAWADPRRWIRSTGAARRIDRLEERTRDLERAITRHAAKSHRRAERLRELLDEATSETD